MGVDWEARAALGTLSKHYYHIDFILDNIDLHQRNSIDRTVWLLASSVNDKAHIL